MAEVCQSECKMWNGDNEEKIVFKRNKHYYDNSTATSVNSDFLFKNIYLYNVVYVLV
jgi:hypothetical protein